MYLWERAYAWFLCVHFLYISGPRWGWACSLCVRAGLHLWSSLADEFKEVPTKPGDGKTKMLVLITFSFAHLLHLEALGYLPTRLFSGCQLESCCRENQKAEPNSCSPLEEENKSSHSCINNTKPCSTPSWAQFQWSCPPSPNQTSINITCNISTSVWVQEGFGAPSSVWGVGQSFVESLCLDTSVRLIFHTVCSLINWSIVLLD